MAARHSGRAAAECSSRGQPGAVPNEIRCYQLSNVVTVRRSVSDRRRERRLASGVDGRRRLAAAGEAAAVELAFSAYGLEFKVALGRSRLIEEHATLVLHDDNGRTELPLDGGDGRELAQGWVIGQPGSYAHGRIVGDSFDGALHTAEETYFVEPSQKYFLSSSGATAGVNGSGNSSFNSIVYRLSDVDSTSFRNATGRCEAVRPPLQKLLILGFESSRKVPRGGDSTQTFTAKKRRSVEASAAAAAAAAASVGSGGGASAAAATGSTKKLSSARHCPLSLYADHRFFSAIGGSNVAATIAEMVYHIGEADRIFRSTSWDGSDSGNNIGFTVARITIFQTVASNPMSAIVDGSTAQTYLDAFSLLPHEQFCTGFAFTNVDFTSGVLGLAWIGSPSVDAAGGGICQRPFMLKDKKVYYNSAIASMKNFGNRVARPMFSITVTHELGHNFGAEHDSADTFLCSPGGPDGNYVMFPVSGDGSRPNNYVFSPCTINNVYPVLLGRLSACFLTTIEESCGNTVVESQEMCDCGSATTCQDVDVCCSIWAPNSTSNCKLRTTSQCSPQVSSCCTSECLIAAASPRVVCRTATECSEVSYCTGASADCPPPTRLPDGTPCGGGSHVCVNGDCLKTLCEYKGLQSCFCSEQQFACDVCCQANSSAPCQSAISLGLGSAGSTSLKIPPNGLCADGAGMCDEHGACVRVLGGLALLDIGQLLQDSAYDLASTFRNYWYYIVLGLCAAIGATAVYCAVNRRVRPVHSIAYKDGKMARMWFESRLRLEALNGQLAAVASNDPYKAWPPPVALARLSYQFPTMTGCEFRVQAQLCTTEVDCVRRLLALGYPMRVLMQARKWQTADVASWESSLFVTPPQAVTG